MQPFGAATLGKAGLILIPILVSFSTFGAANGSIYITSRLIFGAARDSLLPDFLRGLHVKRRTPVPALILLVRAVMLAIIHTQLLDPCVMLSVTYVLQAVSDLSFVILTM